MANRTALERPFYVNDNVAHNIGMKTIREMTPYPAGRGVAISATNGARAIGDGVQHVARRNIAKAASSFGTWYGFSFSNRRGRYDRPASCHQGTSWRGAKKSCEKPSSVTAMREFLPRTTIAEFRRRVYAPRVAER